MDNIETAFLSGGTVGIIAGVIIFLLKCLQKKKLLSTCCGSQLSISDEPQLQPQYTGATAPHDMPKTPQTIPVLEAKRSSITILPLELKEKEEV
jgi:hypothetical protein